MKYALYYLLVFSRLSHPARGAWIEIIRLRYHGGRNEVAPRTGCVD